MFRTGLDRRRSQRRDYAANWEQREPEQVLTRLGEGRLDERFTFAQAAAILGVPQNYVDAFACRARPAYGGNHPRRLESAHDNRRVYTTRRWLLEHIERGEQFRAERREDGQNYLDALEEARRLDAEGVTLYCCVCDVEIGWSLPEPGLTLSKLYCSACGAEEQAARLAALGLPGRQWGVPPSPDSETENPERTAR
jgi:hypothetical protein